MKFSTFFLFLFLSIGYVHAQDDGRTLLRGQVLYRGNNVENENVINSTTGFATITDQDGRFAIRVKAGDQLVFTAVNYQLKIVKVTQAIIDNRRLVVEVTEKVTELDEVVVTPEDQERFLEVKNEDFKQYEYEIDRTTEVENIAESRTVHGMRDGLNFVNIFKALFNVDKNPDTPQRETLKVSEVLRHVYDDEFFVVDLRLPQDKIGAFLVYCDERIPSNALLKKENEFQLIDFLVTQSKQFLKELDEE
ncbi:carboxypeptidase-like regulatory domain-containing protein [Flagellimonas lutaonensis]|uniref:CarboxypepD_reg-like domain-containing protein n=1 Tax=Flagellimonas lutaonensis TaxID=516051 RepID=A0A0D5YV20_9FLAO|nr:carboxypeptidase-like regulatory domain-containing protein [Allomuricauda lutaonensis]AKA35751.1 hypothetical protein VC82_2157 [Allomuricauda lutaonensis]